MKGLFVKDLCLLTAQKKSLILFVALVAVFGTMDGFFAVGYSALLCILLSLSTLSYDEFEHGYTFLFTLPFSRRQYAAEKYLFCFGFGLLGLAFGALLIFLFSVLPGKADAAELLSSLKTFAAFCVLTPALMIPLRIKYGSEHGRLVSSMIFGVIVALFVVINRLIPGIGPQETLPFFGGAAVVLVLLALCLLSFRISVHILEKKEF